MIADQMRGSFTAEHVGQTVSRLLETAKAEAVFGRPIEREGVTIIPVSEVNVGLGVGGGKGFNPAKEQEKQSSGEGAGGGGGAKGRPVAVIVLGRDGVSVRPVLDLTKVLLAVLTTAGVALFWLGLRGQAAPARPPKGRFTPMQVRKMIRQGRAFKQPGRAGWLRLALASRASKA
jgi:uncharacterized spore protein YtfJ